MTAGSLAVLIGSPVAHSLSPIIHRAAFESAGADWSYAALEVAPGMAGEAIAAMRVLGIRGMSVTMPHKSDVASAVDILEPAASALDSVNTVSWEGRSLVGSSTDGAGFLASLREAGVDVGGARVAVIGAGGAARSVIDSIGRADADDIAVINRTPDHADRAAALAELAHRGSFDDVERADIVVNATSLGMDVDHLDAKPGDYPCAPELLHSGQVVVDLVYHPLRTPWLTAANDVGATTIDGLGMLIHQAVLQQERWVGTRPDPKVMRAAAEHELASR